MAERNLQKLLAAADPELRPGVYVFVTTPEPLTLSAKDLIMQFREAEGWTLILPQAVADAHGLAYEYTAAWITMRVHSALDAVGFTAAFAGALGENGISCNVVAGYHHDHLFVASADGQRAVEVLRGLG